MRKLSPIDYFEPIVSHMKQLNLTTGEIEIYLPDSLLLNRETTILFIDNATINYTRGEKTVLSGIVKDKSLIDLLRDLYLKCHNTEEFVLTHTYLTTL